MEKEIVRTPLDNWLRLAPKEYIQRVADESGTTVRYLRLLAKGTERQPSVNLAIRIRAACDKYTHKARVYHRLELPVVSVESLAKRSD